jgi:hypothetical protein
LGVISEASCAGVEIVVGEIPRQSLAMVLELFAESIGESNRAMDKRACAS